MTEGEPTDRLSATRHFVVVLRLVVEVDGKVTGELVDPLSQRWRRFMGLAHLVDALGGWVDDALSSTVGESSSQANTKPTDT